MSLGQDYEWGRDTHKGFTTELAKAAPEAKETKQMWFKLGETDFTSYITAIMAAKPDFLFGAIAGKDSETFLQQAGQMGLFKRVPFPGGLISVTELRQLRKTLPRGIIGLARCPFFAHLKEPLMQKYIKMHRAKFGDDDYPDDWACMHYDARVRPGAGDQQGEEHRDRGRGQGAEGRDARHLPRQAHHARLQQPARRARPTSARSGIRPTIRSRSTSRTP